MLSEASIVKDENQWSNIVVHKRFLMSHTLLIALSALLLVIASVTSILFVCALRNYSLTHLVRDVQCGKARELLQCSEWFDEAAISPPI